MADVFTLEALQAAHGDALILHYGPAGQPRFIVVDGGPKGIFKASLGPRLDEIRRNRGGNVLEIRLLMVSHIDDDHITGVLDLTRMLRDFDDRKAPPPYEILTLWHNSFDDITRRITASFDSDEAIGPVLARAKPKTAEGAALLASVDQGRRLRIDADALNLNMNSPFDDLLVFDDRASALDMGARLRFTVLGPRQAELDRLETKWRKEVAKARQKAKAGGGSALDPADLGAMAAAFVDESVHNLSSVVVLAELGDRSMLLTGDARGDLVLESLREAGLIANRKLNVDVFKVPHHGSERNAAPELFEAVVADHYVFSANGRDGNPDPPTFSMLFEARPTGRYHLWLTNDVAPAVKHIKAKKPRGVTLHVRKPADLSVRIELGDPIQW